MKISSWVVPTAAAFVATGLTLYFFAVPGGAAFSVMVAAGMAWAGAGATTERKQKELEEAAATLGASRLQTFGLVILPALMPALLTGFALAFARALGEYGSVIFIAGNMPMISEITSLLIITKLEQYDYAGATAVAVVMLLVSFVLLLVINGLQAWQRRNAGAPT
jgi:ABC-type sulfate transport system permease component